MLSPLTLRIVPGKKRCALRALKNGAQRTLRNTAVPVPGFAFPHHRERFTR
jgi:hypothetical protein